MTNARHITRFQADLKKFEENSKLNMDQLIRWIVLELWTRIIKRTPVDTGMARSSWDVTIGEPSKNPPPLPNLTSYPAPEKPNLKSQGLGKTPVFITTNLGYVSYLESGASKQAAGGMVRISIAELEVEIDNAVKQL